MSPEECTRFGVGGSGRGGESGRGRFGVRKLGGCAAMGRGGGWRWGSAGRG